VHTNRVLYSMQGRGLCLSSLCVSEFNSALKIALVSDEVVCDEGVYGREGRRLCERQQAHSSRDQDPAHSEDHAAPQGHQAGGVSPSLSILCYILATLQEPYSESQYVFCADPLRTMQWFT
jgi:hypothetical protein